MLLYPYLLEQDSTNGRLVKKIKSGEGPWGPRAQIAASPKSVIIGQDKKKLAIKAVEVGITKVAIKAAGGLTSAGVWLTKQTETEGNATTGESIGEVAAGTKDEVVADATNEANVTAGETVTEVLDEALAAGASEVKTEAAGEVISEVASEGVTDAITGMIAKGIRNIFEAIT